MMSSHGMFATTMKRPDSVPTSQYSHMVRTRCRGVGRYDMAMVTKACVSDDAANIRPIIDFDS